jgi:hypothetical protein
MNNFLIANLLHFCRNHERLRNLTLTKQICDISQSFVSAMKYENISSTLNLVINKLLLSDIQSDQQESKSEQALQIIGHVVAESYANKHGRRQFVVSNASL